MAIDFDRLKAALADRYDLLRELGTGGMATVYLARDLKHSRQVAIKVMLPDIATTLGAERFHREIETAANLTHPHILPLFTSGEAADCLYYVMPYLGGESLRQRLDREKQLPLDEALAIAREVADALSYAHERGIVHRDVKPGNILLADGHAVLTDFGIARAVTAAGGTRLTTSGITLGSPEYASPEQAVGDEHIDGRSDIYALGCVLYEMLTGEPPFTGPTAQIVLARTLKEAPRPIRNVRHTVPIPVVQAVEKALEKVPADRFSTAGHLLRALQTAPTTLPTQPVAAPTEPGTEPAGLQAPTQPTAGPTEPATVTPSGTEDEPFTTGPIEAFREGGPKGLIEELKRRRVFRVGGYYAIAAWLLIQVADAVLPNLGLPDVAITVVIIATVAGFPVALVLAWAYEATGQGVRRQSRGSAPPRPLSLGVKVTGMVLVLAATAWATRFAWQTVAPSPVVLDANRVMVFPLTTSGQLGTDRAVGEDVATMLVHHLDGAGTLRAIDGWTLLPTQERENIRELELEEARALAKSQRSKFMILGRLLPHSAQDSVQVALQLFDLAGDPVPITANADGAAERAWEAGLSALNSLLPTILGAGSAALDEAWLDRDPAAIAAFLAAERDFRRGNFRDALPLYREAIDADASFGLAGIRGAQAAVWIERDPLVGGDPREAVALLRVALQVEMPPRLQQLARGILAFEEGDADAAIRELEAVLAVDPEMAVAWAQLGEVYQHLLPRVARPDSLADAAFTRANELDADAVSVLYHLLQHVIRNRQLGRLPPLLERLRVADAEGDLHRRIEFMSECLREDPADFDWAAAGRDEPNNLFAAAFNVLRGGRHIECAILGLRAVLAADPERVGVVRRGWAVITLGGLLVVQRRDPEAAALLDSAFNAGETWVPQLALMSELAGADLGELTVASVEFLTRGYREQTPGRLVTLAAWDAARGEGALLGPIVDRLGDQAEAAERRADSLRVDRPREARGAEIAARGTRLLHRAAEAHAVLASGDSAGALERFRALHPTAPPGSRALQQFTPPLAVEQLQLVQLLLASGEYREAITVADVFDAPEPPIYILFLRPSLELRVRAAEALGDMELARGYRSRLLALGPDA